MSLALKPALSPLLVAQAIVTRRGRIGAGPAATRGEVSHVPIALEPSPAAMALFTHLIIPETPP